MEYPIDPNSSAVRSTEQKLVDLAYQFHDLATNELEPEKGTSVSPDRQARGEIYSELGDICLRLKEELQSLARGSLNPRTIRPMLQWIRSESTD